MDSAVHVCRWIVSSLASGLLALGLSGCASSATTTGTAPHSTVSRDNALALARHVADSIGGRVYAIAPSGSMIPTLDAGSIVTIETVPLAKLRKGDIVIYRNTSGLAVIHRLYEKHDNLWYVLGDNNATVDHEMVSAGNFIGRVCAIFYTATDTPPLGLVRTARELTAVASIREN